MTSSVPQPPTDPEKYVRAIARSGLSIYDPIPIGDPDLWIPTQELEALLHHGLIGLSLADLPLRTRSKVVKENVCRVLGYPVPGSFRKTRPRFPGQRFDTYVQKSNNLQVWNEDLSPTRRYVLIRVSGHGSVVRVRVVTGDVLALLDTTGTLTQKYQASYTVDTPSTAELVSPVDTAVLAPLVSKNCDLSRAIPTLHPAASEILPINTVFVCLKLAVGSRIVDSGIDQERNRGAELHRIVCAALGYPGYQDDGQFPDIRHQLIEVKLQTSPTIDLGLVRPNSTELLDVPQILGAQIRHCDVRYALYYGETDGSFVTLTNLVVTTGEQFFTRFQQFQGKVLNKKLQIPLPARFFDTS